jgi:hypothetical protein
MKTDDTNTKSVAGADSLDRIVRQIFDRMIRPRLRSGMKVCLPCYMIRKPQWESAKQNIDVMLPQGWSSKWSDKPGVIILSNKS